MIRAKIYLTERQRDELVAIVKPVGKKEGKPIWETALREATGKDSGLEEVKAYQERKFALSRVL